jgi:Membrane domain of glycerophosphoryl diester phosphodiesterase
VLALGLLFIPVGLLITGLQYLLFRVSGLASFVDTAGASNAFVGGLAILLGTLFIVFGLGIVQAACAFSLASLDQEREIGALDAYKLVLRRWRPLLGAFLVAVVVVAVLVGSTIGAIIAIWLLVRWSFLAQVIVLEDMPARGAFRRSSELVRGNWWRVASLALFVTLIALMLGPLLGAILLFVTNASFNFVNLISSLVYVFALPFVAIATTYLYFDLAVEKDEEEPEPVGVQAPSTA